MHSSANNLRVVLVRTRNPLNIGAAARALANFGYTELRLVSPYDPAFREARSAVGATDLLASAQLFPTLADAIADCTYIVATTALQHRAPEIPTASLAQAAPFIDAQLARGPVALLFGSEKTGLSNSDLSHCHLAVHIPTSPHQPSMNLGQAVAVTLYELSRAPSTSPLDSRLPTPERASREGGMLATAADRELLTTLLVDAMRVSAYPGESERFQTESLRRMISRLHLTHRDATLLLGILRQLLWKLHSGNNKNLSS